MTGRGREREVIVSQIVDALNRYGLRTPALIGLEAGRPLAFVGGQLLWMAQPALSLLLPGELIEQAAGVLEDPAAVEMLISQLAQG